MSAVGDLGWLGVVRHGQSTGNVQAQLAEQAGLDVIDIAERDADVPLSDLGRVQARAVGKWLGELGEGERPDLAVVSPYRRTVQTAELALAGTGIDAVFDERLRDRELGVLDLLTRKGVQARLPEEAERRRHLGKLYYRPPGGESWADVLLRLRSLLGDLRTQRPGGRVVLFGHEAIVLLLRYQIEGLDEEELMAIAGATAIANGSVTSWHAEDGRLRLERFNATDHLREAEAPVTRQEDVHG
ncbi:histidine phosphatase family protein [Dactylosporangium sp. CA-139066]|uniref:histidine phosphatase family protein n=1 Tax=Dactylosporangium sp. CA-139066 TaxID=3239930 RepID=UPI003D9004BF